MLTAFPTNISERTTLHNFARGMQLELGMRIGMRIRDKGFGMAIWILDGIGYLVEKFPLWIGDCRFLTGK